MSRLTKDDIKIRSQQLIPLTRLEMDTNFLALKQSLEDIESHITRLDQNDLSITQLTATIAALQTSLDNSVASLNAQLVAKDTQVTTNTQNIIKLAADQPIDTPAITFTVNPSSLEVPETNETDSAHILFTLASTNMITSDTYGWAISGTNIDANDIKKIEIITGGVATEVTPLALSGTITNASISHQIKIYIARDETNEGGNEILTLTVTPSGQPNMPAPESRDVIIRDTSLNSTFRSATYLGPAPSGPPTLYSYLNNLSAGEGFIWFQDWNLSDLLLTQTEKNNIITLAQALDYTDLINCGFSTTEIDQLIVDATNATVDFYNTLINTYFSTFDTLLLDAGVLYGGTSTDNEGNLEFVATNNLKYVRDTVPTHVGVIYQEEVSVPDLTAQAEIEVDAMIAAAGLTGQTAADAKVCAMAFMAIFIPVVVGIINSATTTVDVYGYKQLTPGS